MVSKLAKNIAHFFVIQKVIEESKEIIYAYGMELLISDVLNTIIVLLIALFSTIGTLSNHSDSSTIGG